ncbi:MAG TPA: SUMF1/EgtB/PvdO family nonheme iron enzyme [Cyclobacteriaceae bacterium]|jgi:gliding motility-associated lipoprotein GldK|nr:SUMF1/EgtB/PvdO family nonheme iron enzyme [Cyclobacteriaceae bacterium]
MKNLISRRSLYYVAILGLGGTLAGCGLLGIGGKKSGGDARGELVGAQNRPPFVMPLPYGMVPIPPGTFHMGQADEDPASTQINFNKQVTIGPLFMDDTEITNNEYRQFTDFFLVDKVQLPDPFVTPNEIDFKTKYYPDTTVWTKDFSHHMGDPLVEYYWDHPGYKEYPVVGISWEAAQYFGKWRTSFLNDWRKTNEGQPPVPAFRLPSEAEWEYAARGGRDMAKYPWGNPYIRNSKGCMLANFKPGRGNYYDDGFEYTAPVGQYFPNDYGLMDMSGNVSEWCLDDFNPASVPTVWDLNPQYIDKNAYTKDGQSSATYNARKVIRGGSWKDVAYYLETGTRTYEYKDSTRAYIGFRCVMTNIERSAVRGF